jgi:6-phosphogluconolactonase
MNEGPMLSMFDDVDALAEAAALVFVDHARSAIAQHGRFLVALSGGSTPEPVYQRLGAEPFISRVEWNRVRFCWSDERCVQPDDAESNFRMCNRALLSKLQIDHDNICRVKGELGPAVAAVEYERELRALFGTESGALSLRDGERFDLILLGMGNDGHTASLFPRSPALLERESWAVPVESPGATGARWRVTLTLPVINAAASVVFLVSGAEKSAMLRRVLDNSASDEILPARMVRPVAGKVRWMVDSAAAP